MEKLTNPASAPGALVIDGKFECYVDGRQTTLGGGESVYWPRGAIQQIPNVTPDRFLKVEEPQ